MRAFPLLVLQGCPLKLRPLQSFAEGSQGPGDAHGGDVSVPFLGRRGETPPGRYLRGPNNAPNPQIPPPQPCGTTGRGRRR